MTFIDPSIPPHLGSAVDGDGQVALIESLIARLLGGPLVSGQVSAAGASVSKRLSVIHVILITSWKSRVQEQIIINYIPK